jgi:hypothetical protein
MVSDWWITWVPVTFFGLYQRYRFDPSLQDREIQHRATLTESVSSVVNWSETPPHTLYSELFNASQIESTGFTMIAPLDVDIFSLETVPAFAFLIRSSDLYYPAKAVHPLLMTYSVILQPLSRRDMPHMGAERLVWKRGTCHWKRLLWTQFSRRESQRSNAGRQPLAAHKIRSTIDVIKSSDRKKTALPADTVASFRYLVHQSDKHLSEWPRRRTLDMFTKDD